MAPIETYKTQSSNRTIKKIIRLRVKRTKSKRQKKITIFNKKKFTITFRGP